MLSTFLALSPILVLLVLLLGLRRPLFQAAPLTWAYVVLLVLTVWRLDPRYVMAGAARGLLISLDVLLIVFGAVFFLESLKESRVIESIQRSLARITPDRRLQAVVIAWLFGSFIEGSAGFGTPAAIVAPLLVAIGFPALTAILVSLAANSAAVTFGAVGTPIRVGFAGLDTGGVAETAGLINLGAGLVVPLLVIALVLRSDSRWRWRPFLECVPWALWAGLAFLVPYALFAHIGQEFPSLLGAPVGLIAVVLSLRMGFLVPKNSWNFQGAPAMAPMALKTPLWESVRPYLLLIVLLLAGKWVFTDIRYSFDLLPDVRHTLGAFNPGFAFLLAVAILWITGRRPLRELRRAANRSTRSLFKPIVAVIFITALVQTMILSRFGSGGEPGIMETIAQTFETGWLPLLSPFIGAFGSFMAGSATVSNLLFGPIQAGMAEGVGSSVKVILALQLAGAAAGNMIALPNILAVEATVNEPDREAEILRQLWLPCTLYIVLIALVGILFAE